MLIGAAPSPADDQQGLPFAGPAGNLLDAMLAAIGQSRQTVYLTHLVKCAAPDTRDPSTEEVARCNAFLQQQIQLIRPKLILALGQTAAQHLLATNQPLGQLRNSLHRLRETGTPLLVTHHPAHLLQHPADKRQAWQDLQEAQKYLQNS